MESELEINTLNSNFKKAFEAAKNIVEEINKKKEYIPVIILLTDGLDFEPEETINYIEKEVSYIYIIILIKLY